MELEWSKDALADLQRFALFLHDRDPNLARDIARAIIEKTTVLQDHPRLGRPIEGQEHFRQLVLSVRNARYVFQYFYDGRRLIMLRVFHGRENEQAGTTLSGRWRQRDASGRSGSAARLIKRKMPDSLRGFDGVLPPLSTSFMIERAISHLHDNGIALVEDAAER